MRWREPGGVGARVTLPLLPPQDGVGEEVLKMSTEEIVQRTRLLDSEIKVVAKGRGAGPGLGSPGLVVLGAGWA